MRVNFTRQKHAWSIHYVNIDCRQAWPEKKEIEIVGHDT